MSLIDKEVIDDICSWAETHENKNIFLGISEEETSYYVDRDMEDTYIMEYSINDVFKIKEALKEYSGLTSESFILKKMTVEICRNCYVNQGDADNDKSIRQYIPEEQMPQGILPEFRYEF